MRNIIKHIRQSCCRHSNLYAAPVFKMGSHEVMAYEYICRRCGKLLYRKEARDVSKE